VLQSGKKKLFLGLLATITLQVVTFRVYTPFPGLLPFFKLILEVMFCKVFSTVCDSASITSIVKKWHILSFIFYWGNNKVAGGQVRRVRWVGDDSHVVFFLSQIPW
jgi:hypothetical protein